MILISRLSIFLIFLISHVCCSIVKILIPELIEKHSKLFNRASSVLVEKEISYLSSLMMSLYSLPSVQDTLIRQVESFDKYKNMVLPSFETVPNFSYFFGKSMVELRRGGKRIPINSEAIKMFVLISGLNESSFWPQVLGNLSSSVKALFTFRYSTKNYSDKKKPSYNARYFVTLFLNEDYVNLATYLNDFQSQTLQDNQVVCDSISHPPILAINVVRHPKLSTTSASHRTFIKHLLRIEKILVIDGNRYRLASRIEYDESDNTYSGIGYDLNNDLEYIYKHDGSVKTVSSDVDHILDRKSVLLFYLKETSESITFAKPGMSGTVQGPQQLNQTHQKTESNKRKIDNLIQSDVDSIRSLGIYRPESKTNFTPLSLAYFSELDVYFIEKAARGFPVQFLDFQAKLLYKLFELGSRNFSFKRGTDGKPFVALEIFLISLASSPKIVKSLFAMFDAGKLTELQKLITFAVIKMLVGCTEILLERIVECFERNHNLNLKDIYSSTHVDVDFAYKYHQIARIFGLKDLIYIPKKTTIEYSDLISDDPVSISTNQIYTVIRPVTLLVPRPASIKGLWIDHRDNESDNCRKRTIFKSDSEVFFIYIDRRSDQPQSSFNRSFYFANGDEYKCVGFVSLGTKENEEFLEFIAVDFFQHEKIIRGFIPDQKNTMDRINEQNANHLAEMSKYNSVLVLYSKNVSEKFERKATNSISAKLVKEVIRDFATDLNMQFKHDV